MAAVDVIREDGVVTGIVTEDGRHIGCRVVINAEGSQGVLAVKAGVREKYPPETISLADVYDYEMPKEDVDRIFGHTLRFCWGWDEQMVAPPLGYGNGLMVWPYKAMGRSLAGKPTMPASWISMFYRYFRNWENNSFDKLSTEA